MIREGKQLSIGFPAALVLCAAPEIRSCPGNDHVSAPDSPGTYFAEMTIQFTCEVHVDSCAWRFCAEDSVIIVENL